VVLSLKKIELLLDPLDGLHDVELEGRGGPRPRTTRNLKRACLITVVFDVTTDFVKKEATK
jgi:hypothetical protein